MLFHPLPSQFDIGFRSWFFLWGFFHNCYLRIAVLLELLEHLSHLCSFEAWGPFERSRGYLSIHVRISLDQKAAELWGRHFLLSFRAVMSCESLLCLILHLGCIKLNLAMKVLEKILSWGSRMLNISGA